MTVPEIDELFAQTLSGDYEDEAPWEAVHALRRIGTREVFELAAEWCQSTDALARARGADVLAQLGNTADHPTNSFPEESFSLIARLIQREKEPQPLAAAIAALGHIGNPLAISLIKDYASHPSPEVRFAVAFALSCFPNDPISIATLLQLMQDTDEDVRDWATFGLGVQGDTDSVEIRDSLVRSLEDSDEDVREEAMVGLAKRKDQRVLPTLLQALGVSKTGPRVIEAALLMLCMEGERKDGKDFDYEAALRKRFSL
jgi:HEAT repeat protein